MTNSYDVDHGLSQDEPGPLEPVELAQQPGAAPATGNTARDQEMYAAGIRTGEENTKHNAAIRAGVPDGWKLVPVKATDEMEAAAENDYVQTGYTFPRWKSHYAAMLNAAPAAPGVSAVEQDERSATHGMTLGERIAHVGGRTNAQGYVEFGSPMAVDALIQHVLRDIDCTRQEDDGAYQARYRLPGGQWSSWGHVVCGVKGHEQELRYLPGERHPAPAAGDAQTAAARDVLAERQRQISVEGWTPEHDDRHTTGALATAAGCYAMFTLAYPPGDPVSFWPWSPSWWKPSDESRRNLVKAGALILAEIERLDRAAQRKGDA